MDRKEQCMKLSREIIDLCDESDLDVADILLVLATMTDCLTGLLIKHATKQTTAKGEMYEPRATD